MRLILPALLAVGLVLAGCTSRTDESSNGDNSGKVSGKVTILPNNSTSQDPATNGTAGGDATGAGGSGGSDY